MLVMTIDNYIRIRIRAEELSGVRRIESAGLAYLTTCPVTTATNAPNNEPNSLCSTAFGTLSINKSRFNSAYAIYPTLTVCYSIAQFTVRFWGLPLEHLRPLAFLRLPGFNHNYGYKRSYRTGLHHNRAVEWPI